MPYAETSLFELAVSAFERLPRKGNDVNRNRKGGYMRQVRLLRRAAVTVAVLSAFTLVTAVTAIGYLGYRGAHPSPNPLGRDATSSDGFPPVDWAYWTQVNPDIIGWITVPGTAIDHPIVQAHPQDPDFYLTHDLYGEPNYTGCPYLDARCDAVSGLLRCPNSVVYGHNMGWSREVFGDLLRYADKSWGEEHRDVLLQTPDARLHLKVQALAVVPGWDAMNRVEFSSDGDFAAWWSARFEDSELRYEAEPRTGRNLITLCTCSYSRWDNERTLVYCQAA
jgi:sortase B